MIRAGWQQTFGFYPSTRTLIEVGYQAEAVQLFNPVIDADETFGNTGTSISLAAPLNLNYYFSPALRLLIDVQPRVYYANSISTFASTLDYDPNRPFNAPSGSLTDFSAGLNQFDFDVSGFVRLRYSFF
jgi:hypothetical protein